MKFTRNGIEWGGWCYIQFYFLTKKERKGFTEEPKLPRIGLTKVWYDGPHAQLNLWFFAIGWSTPWTSYDPKRWDL